MSADFQQLIRYRKTGSTVTGISSRNFRPTPLRVPPFTEQNRIVAEVERRLSVVGALEASVVAELARAARLRQAVLKQAFEGRLVPTEMELYRRGEVASPPEPASVLLERIRVERKTGARERRRKGSAQLRLPET